KTVLQCLRALGRIVLGSVSLCLIMSALFKSREVPVKAKEPAYGKDLTPDSGSETDVTRLGRGPKPSHEKTAVEDDGHVDWAAISESPAYRNLVKEKKRFVVPACLFFVIY